MSSLLLLNGSPRGARSNSMRMLGHVAQGWADAGGAKPVVLHLAKRADFEQAVAVVVSADKADTVLLGMPLYTDSMPGLVAEFFEALAPYATRRDGPRMAFLVQSGFSEALHSRGLERYLAKLAPRLGSPYSGTIVRGGGEALQAMPDEALRRLFGLLHTLGEQLARDGRFAPDSLADVAGTGAVLGNHRSCAEWCVQGPRLAVLLELTAQEERCLGPALCRPLRAPREVGGSRTCLNSTSSSVPARQGRGPPGPSPRRGYRFGRSIARGSGQSSFPNEVEVVAVADASDPKQAIEAARGASVVYQALNPPYHLWHELFPGLQAGAVAAAQAAGARYVSLENLYMYGHVEGEISERSPSLRSRARASYVLRMAAELQELHRRGELEVAQTRASDYYGPGVTASALGDRTFEPLLAGKSAELAGSADVRTATPTSRTSVELRPPWARTTRLSARSGSLPHAPALTGRQTLAPAFAAAGLQPKVKTVGARTLRVAGLFMPAAREMVEMMYEFTDPMVVDSTKFERAFGWSATPLEEGMQRTIDWYRQRVG